MTRRTLIVIASAAILLGLLAPPAFAARSVSAYKKVFGHSTSCTMVRASINSDNRKAGGEAKNFYGCSGSNPPRDVPPGYLGIRSMPARYNGYICATVPPFTYNASTADAQTTSTSLSFSSSCPSNSTYYGRAEARRWSEGAGRYEPYPNYAWAHSGNVGF